MGYTARLLLDDTQRFSVPSDWIEEVRDRQFRAECDEFGINPDLPSAASDLAKAVRYLRADGFTRRGGK